MAQVTLINARTYRAGVNQAGDIVGIFEDSHIFDSNEHDMFDIIAVPNITRAELEGQLKTPEIRRAIDKDGNEINVWRNSDKDSWKKLVKPTKYAWTTLGIDTARAEQ